MESLPVRAGHEALPKALHGVQHHAYWTPIAKKPDALRPEDGAIGVDGMAPSARDATRWRIDELGGCWGAD